MEVKQRFIGLDILRAIAVVSVVCGHFFSINTPFNETPCDTCSMFFQSFLKEIFGNLGVPMFLMLSGYLNSHKTPSKSYYKGIIRVLYSYLLISVITWAVLSQTHSVKDLFFGIINYNTIGYAWYIEMYIGLFLLIPFINIVLQKCFEDDFKAKALMLTMILLFSLPTTLSRKQFHFLPNYWLLCFPVLCYSIGAYIRHYQPIINRKALAIVSIVVILMVSPSITLIINNIMGGGKSFISLFGANYSIAGLLVNYVVFVLLYRVIKVDKISTFVISKLALYSLNIYLFSYLFDQLVYPIFIPRFYVSQDQFVLYLIPIVSIVVTLSFLSSVVVDKTFIVFKKITKI